LFDFVDVIAQLFWEIEHVIDLVDFVDEILIAQNQWKRKYALVFIVRQLYFYLQILLELGFSQKSRQWNEVGAFAG
jgi:hypothetical protein